MAVYLEFREEQATFRRGKRLYWPHFCVEKYYWTMHRMAAISLQYVKFVDFAKDWVQQCTLAQPLADTMSLRNPFHFVEIIRSFFSNVASGVGGSGILFEVAAGVRQGCIMSTVVFNLVVDWIMGCTTDYKEGASEEPFSLIWNNSLRWQFRLRVTVTHQLTNSRDDLATQLLHKANWPKHQKHKDRSYGTEHHQQSSPGWKWRPPLCDEIHL